MIDAVLQLSLAALSGGTAGAVWRYNARRCSDCTHSRASHVRGGSCLKRAVEGGLGSSRFCRCDRFTLTPTPQPPLPGPRLRSIVSLSAALHAAQIDEVKQLKPYMQRHVARMYGLNPDDFPEAPPLPVAASDESIIGWRAWRIVRATDEVLLKSLQAASDESIIGWRAWRIVRATDEVLLKSLHLTAIWEPGKPLVAHALSPYNVAGRDGIHVYRDRSGIAEHLRQMHDPPDGYAIGTVALWGRVIEHEHGYRAEYAYPQKLFVRSAEIARALARTYGCEVEVEA